MRFFLSLTNSPKQADQLKSFLDELDASYFNICVIFDLSDQTLVSQTQYLSALKKLKASRTLFLSLRNYSRIHSLFLFFNRKFHFVEVILGNIIGYYCKEYFETVSKSKKIILDDGLIVVSIAKLVAKTKRTEEFIFYSAYTQLLDNKVNMVASLSKFSSKNISKFKFEPRTLGVFGSPLVENGFMSNSELEHNVLSAMKFHGCTSIYYYMHRRETSKFKSNRITEIYDDTLDSLDLILREEVIPRKWWSIYSSALVDLSLFNWDHMVYSFTRVESVSSMNNPYLLGKGIATLDSIYEIYTDLNFKEVECQS